MSDQPETHFSAEATAPRPTTAGGLLRQARQAQGLHIAALAAAIKVVPRKLELLEADQFDQLPDATFTRALAQSVCRSLKVDPGPVLALLPPLNDQQRLEQVAQGLNTPFRERPGRLATTREWASFASPLLWIAGLVILLTGVVYLLPAQWVPFSLGNTVARVRAADTPPAPTTLTTTLGAGTDAASGASSPTSPGTDATTAAAATAVPAALPGAPAPAAEPAADHAEAAVAASAAAPAAGVLQFRATSQAWVEATDAHGRALISRLLMPGENVGLDGTPPFKVRIGNVVGTEVVYKGQPVPLARTKDNTARLELK